MVEGGMQAQGLGHASGIRLAVSLSAFHKYLIWTIFVYIHSSQTLIHTLTKLPRRSRVWHAGELYY